MDPQLVIDNLNNHLETLSPQEPDWRPQLKTLSGLCGESGLLPTSYNLTTDFTVIGEFPYSHGGFSDVWRASYQGRLVAFKALRVHASDRDKIKKAFAQEAVFWKRLNHSNIVRFLGVCTTKAFLGFISEWMENGDVLAYLERHPQRDRATLLAEVASALDYMHSQRVVHGDIKGRNILINHLGKACLSDFGLTVAAYNTESLGGFCSTLSNAVGTVRWTAPELLMNVVGSTSTRPCTGSDVYSFGILMWELHTLQLPFAEYRHDWLAARNITNGARPARHEGITDALWTLMSDCWSSERSERPGSPVILSRLQAEVMERDVRQLLVQLTRETFWWVSNQIIAWTNRSENEKVGGILGQVTRLVIETALNDSTHSELYARLCCQVIAKISPAIVDDTILPRHGQDSPAGPKLFHVHLLNECYKSFERYRPLGAPDVGSASAQSIFSADSAKDMMENTRRRLQLIKFISELYERGMLTVRIVHKCILDLLDSLNYQEEAIMSLWKFMLAVGPLLDLKRGAKSHMDGYFTRIKNLASDPKVTPRIRCKLKHLMTLRERKWTSGRVIEVKLMLNRLNSTSFHSASDEIDLLIIQLIKDEGRQILSKIVQLVVDKASDDHFNHELYARLCHKMKERLSAVSQNHTIGPQREREVPISGNLFKRQLHECCWQELTRRQPIDDPDPTASHQLGNPSDTKMSSIMAGVTDGCGKDSPAALMVDRQYFGLVKFISNLFELDMVTEPIIHHIIRTLFCLSKISGPNGSSNLQQQGIDTLCYLMHAVGGLLDARRANSLMDIYFSRMSMLLKDPEISWQMHSRLEYLLELRGRNWRQHLNIYFSYTSTLLPDRDVPSNTQTGELPQPQGAQVKTTQTAARVSFLGREK